MIRPATSSKIMMQALETNTIRLGCQSHLCRNEVGLVSVGIGVEAIPGTCYIGVDACCAIPETESPTSSNVFSNDRADLAPM